ncbi:hypothetical protein A3Q56_02922 [Intoshia linei]|uniref:NADH dehydrogenase [ubiquinone] 1 alpha subcomplex subunit 7 n=1 Tax=Intoshia linei TaxID=1819745 RepID=A0A177B6S4_9BILA|nr:hypothetical protein A3Q56_02922 [Intoshia linei]
MSRNVKEHERFESDIADRSQPPPIIPHGIYNKLSKNPYHLRSGRHLQEPSKQIFTNESLKKLNKP